MSLFVVFATLLASIFLHYVFHIDGVLYHYSLGLAGGTMLLGGIFIGRGH